eukprot:scaffold13723_cov119-Isochrysis_galbana.AAC.1
MAVLKSGAERRGARRERTTDTQTCPALIQQQVAAGCSNDGTLRAWASCRRAHAAAAEILGSPARVGQKRIPQPQHVGQVELLHGVNGQRCE